MLLLEKENGEYRLVSYFIEQGKYLTCYIKIHAIKFEIRSLRIIKYTAFVKN